MGVAQGILSLAGNGFVADCVAVLALLCGVEVELIRSPHIVFVQARALAGPTESWIAAGNRVHHFLPKTGEGNVYQYIIVLQRSTNEKLSKATSVS